MISDSQIYIPVIAALLGTLVGALLKEAGTYFQGYREDKRMLRRVLFNQMDLWLAFRATESSWLISVILEELKNEFIKMGATPEQVDKFQMKDLRPVITLLRSANIGAPEKIMERYQQSVNDIAQIDPILAFTINNRPEIKISYEHLIEEAIKVEKRDFTLESDNEVLQVLMTANEDKIYQRTIKLIEADMNCVARKIHFWTKWRLLGTLNDFDSQAREGARDYARHLIVTLLPFFQSEELQNKVENAQEIRTEARQA